MLNINNPYPNILAGQHVYCRLLEQDEQNPNNIRISILTPEMTAEDKLNKQEDYDYPEYRPFTSIFRTELPSSKAYKKLKHDILYANGNNPNMWFHGTLYAAAQPDKKPLLTGTATFTCESTTIETDAYLLIDLGRVAPAIMQIYD